MTKPTKHTAPDVIAAIQGSAGIKSSIAKRLGVNRLTVDTYLKRWKAVQDAYDEECEGIIDMTESTVLKAIKEGDVGTAKWYLAHKAKSRGYVSRQQIEHSGQIDVRSLTDEELEAIARGGDI
jgi:hypothetical protein